MHHHLEIILPPNTDDIKGAVEEVMQPFYEGNDSNDEESRSPFYDFYVIGGRWSGNKLVQTFDKDKLEAFYEALRDSDVKVSSLQSGKETLARKQDVDKTTKLWKKYFPDFKGDCPLFSNYGNQYEHNLSYPDVMKVGEVVKSLTCSKVIVATPDYKEKKLEAKTMVEDSYWNGVSWNDTDWDNLVTSVIKKHNNGYSRAEEEYKKKRIVTDEWIMVTVDYHS